MGLMNPEAVTDVVPPARCRPRHAGVPNINDAQVLEDEVWSNPSSTSRPSR